MKYIVWATTILSMAVDTMYFTQFYMEQSTITLQESYMTFNDILTDKDTVASKKLTQLTALVADIRTAYGNSDVDIDIPYVNTPDGMVSIAYLDDESKVALAGNQVRAASIEAVEICECTQGAVLDKEIEGLIATDPILCNLAASSGSKYL